MAIGNRLESVTYLGADGFGVAAATLVGQNLGAGRPERAESGAWISVRSMTVLSLVMTVLMLAIPRELFSVFTNDPAVLDLCATYARILAVCQLATGIEGVLSGAFAGAGNTVPPMTIHVVFGVLRPILAVVLAVHFGMGMAGIALTISGSCILRAFLLASIFRKGRWKSHRPPVGGPLPISPIPSEDAPDLAN